MNAPSKTITPRPVIRMAAVLVLLAAVPVQGQTAPAVPAAPSPTDEIVELSPFEVSVDQDTGYTASSTLAGSRLNTSLRDTPATISVMTSDFLADIGAFDLTEAVGYAVNVELQLDDDRPATNGNETISSYQSYRVRGMKASTARNYFLWDLPTETALIERIEDSRGPNSVLFGIASPGGLLNSNTKQARFGRAFQTASLTFGSEDTRRAALDINQPLIANKLAARINLVYNDTQNFRHWAYQKQMRGHFAVTYRLTDKTRVRAEYEKGQIDSNQPKTIVLSDDVLLWNSLGRPTFATVPSSSIRTANGIAQISNSAAQPRVTYIANSEMLLSMRGTLVSDGPGNPIMDPTIADDSINVGGPGQDRFSRFNALSAYLEHQFSPTTFVELAFNHQDHVFDRYDARGGNVNSLFGDPNQNLPGGGSNPFVGQLMIESNWSRLLRRDNVDTGRVTFSKEFDAGKWGSYRFAVLGEYEKASAVSNVYGHKWVDAVTGLAAFNAAPGNAANNVWLREYVIEGDWSSYHVPSPHGLPLENVTEPLTGRTLSARWFDGNPGESATTRKAAMVAAQARYFEGRLVLAGGLRRDEIDEYNFGTTLDPVTGEDIIARNPADADQDAPRWENNVGTTSTFGIVYHVKPWLSLIYNRADNIELPARGQTTLPPDGMPGAPIAVPPPEGVGEDFGVGLSLLDGRIYTKVLYYQTAGKYQSTTFSSPTRSANTRIMDALQSSGIITQEERDFRTRVGGQGLFDHESEGLEIQVTANLTKNWRFTGSFAEADAVESNKFLEWLAWEQQTIAYLDSLDAANPGTDVLAIKTSADGGSRTLQGELDFIRTGDNALGEQTESSGVGKLGNRRHKVSFFTRYNFDFSFLRGLYVGAGYKHQSKMYAGLQDDGQKVYTNSFWSADAMAGYSVRGLQKGRNLSFQLNVTNIFDNREPLITRLDPAGTVVRLVVAQPLGWRFTTNFEF